jgi:hypothetical protein
MTSKSAAVAVVPPAESRDVAIDRALDAPPVHLANSITGLVETLKNSLQNMDDISVEVSAHSDQTRSSAHIKFRAYRHRNA